MKHGRFNCHAVWRLLDRSRPSLPRSIRSQSCAPPRHSPIERYDYVDLHDHDIAVLVSSSQVTGAFDEQEALIGEAFPNPDDSDFPYLPSVQARVAPAPGTLFLILTVPTMVFLFAAGKMAGQLVAIRIHTI